MEAQNDFLIVEHSIVSWNKTATVHMLLVPIPTTGCLKNCLLLKNEYRDPHFLHIYSQLATQE